GRSAAVIGAGPAGMAAAQQLRRGGHRVVLFERDEAAGGLIRFGVPDFKIEKWLVERRAQQPRDEGVDLRCGVAVGVARRGDPSPGAVTAKDKHVVVIGGGDTGADCVGNSLREGAAGVAQLELLPEPPPKRPDDRTPWPLWPQKYRLSYAMEEGKAVGKAEQDFSIV